MSQLLFGSVTGTSNTSTEPRPKLPKVTGVHVAVVVEVKCTRGATEGGAEAAEIGGINVAVAVGIAEQAVQLGCNGRVADEDEVVAGRAVAVAIDYAGVESRS